MTRTNLRIILKGATCGCIATVLALGCPGMAQTWPAGDGAQAARTTSPGEWQEPTLRVRSASDRQQSAAKNITQPAETFRTAPKLSAAHASADLNSLEKSVPPKALRLYLVAVHELHQGQASLAKNDSERAIRRDPQFADAYALKATASLVQRDYSRACAVAEQAVRIDPTDEKAWVIAATAENYLGQYEKAAAALAHVESPDQSTWQVAYQWARAEAGQQDSEKALEWSNRAALSAPSTFAPLHLLRASALLAVDKYNLSADELEIYLQLIAPDAPQYEELTQELHRLRKLAQQKDTVSVRPASPSQEYNALAN